MVPTCVAAVSLDSSRFAEAGYMNERNRLESVLGVPCVDPIREGPERLAEPVAEWLADQTLDLSAPDCEPMVGAITGWHGAPAAVTTLPEDGEDGEVGKGSEAGVWLVQLSDIHARADSAIVYGAPWRKQLCDLLKAAHRSVPLGAAVLTGDIADDGGEASYAAVIDVLAGWPGLDTRLVAGNHDDAASLLAQADPAVLNRVLPIGDQWQVVLLDSSLPGAVAGRIGADQLAWCDALLGATDRWTVLAIHHPPISPCPTYPDCCLADADSLLDLVDHHESVRAVLSGHAHWPFALRRGSTSFYGAPSTALQVHHRAGFHTNTDLGGGCLLVGLNDDGSTKYRVLWLDEASGQRLLTGSW